VLDLGHEVWMQKPGVLGGIALARFTWDEARQTYVRGGVQVRNAPAGAFVLEASEAPESLQLEQMEAVLEDAVVSVEGESLVFRLGQAGLRLWRNLGSARRERFV
jgi:hypothetical protein